MKLYEITLRQFKTDQFIYAIEDRKIVSPDKLIITICDMLNRFPDGASSVEIKHVECVL
jgi:hypothetical protein